MSNPIEVYVAVKEEAIRKSWADLIKAVHYSIEYGVNCNDLSSHELAENIEVALDKFAKENALPIHDWETEYEEQYKEQQAD